MNRYTLLQAVGLAAVFTLAPCPSSPPLVLGDEKADKAELAKKELHALQGTWKLVAHERDGKDALAALATARLTIDKDKVTYQEGSATALEGKVEVDPTRNPRCLDISFSSGRKDLTIYVKAGDYLIQCGNSGGKARPTEFTSGSEKGGDYLNVWKREK